MKLHLLPHATGSAAENMALDLMLLQRWPGLAARFRHYDWREPSFTFGLSQPIAYVRAQLPPGRFDLCRRPSGGGVVDHRNDWTYTLVFPRGHALCDCDARESYRIVHEALAGALRKQGEDVHLQPPPDEESGGHPPSVCFQRPEPYDVLRADGAKVAGAAQKRNRHGLLLQGSIERGRVGADLDWERFEPEFVTLLSEASECEAQPGPGRSFLRRNSPI
jgi:lipoyl(octanoyl) transferase